MTETKPTSALAAFAFLLEVIEDEVEIVNRAGESAFGKGDYESARTALNRADQLKEIRHKVAALRDEWEMVLPAHLPIEAASKEHSGVEHSVVERQAVRRLPRGICTPEKAYCNPILMAVIELGDSAKAEDVLTRVEQLMRTILKHVDYEFINSGTEERWRKTANWARYILVKRGFLKSNSPHGIWEISDKGRQYMDSNDR